MLLKLEDHRNDKPERPDPSRQSRVSWFVVAPVMLGCIILLIWTNPRGAISPGEAFTWFLSTQSPQEAMRILRQDTDAPLHHMLMRVCIHNLPIEPAAILRHANWIYLAIALPVVACIAATFTARASIVTAWFLLIVWLWLSWGPFDGQVGTLLAVFGLFTAAATLAYFKFKRWWWVLLCAFSISGALWTHNAGLLVLLAVHVVWLVQARRRGMRWLVPLAVLDHLILAMYIPWMPSLVDQLRQTLNRDALTVAVLLAGTVVGSLLASYLGLTLLRKRRTPIKPIPLWQHWLPALLVIPTLQPLSRSVAPMPLLRQPEWNHRTLIAFHPAQLQLMADYAYRGERFRPSVLGLPLPFRANDPPRRELDTSGSDLPGVDDLRQRLSTGQYDRLVVVGTGARQIAEQALGYRLDPALFRTSTGGPVQIVQSRVTLR